VLVLVSSTLFTTTILNITMPGHIRPKPYQPIISFLAFGKDRREVSGYGCFGSRYYLPF
jgi:hypothetical protein